MGFSLRKVINRVASAARQAAPLLAAVPGPVGMAAMAYTSLRATAMPGGAPIPDYGPVDASPSSPAGISGMPQMLPAIFGGAGGAAVRGLGGLASRLGAGGLVRAAGGLVRSAAGKVRGVMLGSGRFISSGKASALAKRVGLEAAAAALGVGAIDLAEMILSDQESKGKKRHRGVSASDIKRTKRTIRTIERMHHQIVNACRSAHVAPRRHHFQPRRAACPPVRLVKVK
jgi:hypothetical protein